MVSANDEGHNAVVVWMLSQALEDRRYVGSRLVYGAKGEDPKVEDRT